MFFLPLSMLKDAFSTQSIETFDEYLSSLSPAALRIITAHKLSLATKIEYNECMRFLKACMDSGLMYKRYALRCPECSGWLKITDDINELVSIEEEYCPHCDESFTFDETNIASNVEVIFSLKEDDIPFGEGQQLSEPSLTIEGQAVAPTIDLSISRAVQVHLVTYDELFSPSNEEFEHLEEEISRVKCPQKTTVATGATLENLCVQLFRLCKIFKATTKFKNETNQIDNFVRITSYLPEGLFGINSNYFAVECKNESRTPKGDYLSKLHSILHTMGGKLGIIVSKKSVPNTYPKLAHDYYLRDDMCLIWFTLQELETMVKKRGNLLEMIDTKVLELKTNSKKPFSDIGLSDM